MSEVTYKARAGRGAVASVRKRGQSPQDGLTRLLTCLRWFANHAGLSFTQSVEHSYTEMIHDRVNRKGGGSK